MAELSYGKTSPRLAHDIKSHSPAALVLSRRVSQNLSAWTPQAQTIHNKLLDPPPCYDGGQFSEQTQTFGNCRHTFSTVHNHTVVPSENRTLGKGETWQYAAICQSCRWHLKVSVSWALGAEEEAQACPKLGFPLHHFVQKGHEVRADGGFDTGMETYHFACTCCLIVIRVVYYPQRLTEDWIGRLTDGTNLQARCQAFMQAEPDRIDPKPERAISVLEALSAYIRDGLNTTEQRKRIPRANRRFILSFGTDCTDLLQWLGFTEENEQWLLPDPPPAGPFDPYSQRHLLEDIREELLARLREWPESEKQSLRNFSAADRQITVDSLLEVILGAKDYGRCTSSLNLIKPTPSAQTAYDGLGVLPDFADDVLLFAFNQQVANDRAHSVYYYDCLLTLNNSRSSDSLNVAVVTFASQGFVSSQDVQAAYRYFTIDPTIASGFGDENILGIFQSRLSDSAPAQESELRRQLRILGQARGSATLTNAADNVVQTVEQALRWLEPSYNGSLDLTDEQIISLATAKVAERPDQLQQCRDAIQIIHQQRQSPFLLDWLNTGNYNLNYSGEEDLAAAYRFFNIADRTATIDLSVLETAVMSLGWDDPAKAEQARKHYEIIKDHVEAKSKTQADDEKPDYSKPIGLVNMGNTCYLNCLLQYFYTITPVRETVVNFDHFKMDTTLEGYHDKIVINAIVRRAEAEKAQDFVMELRTLFQKMTYAAGPVVNPSWKLAGQALSKEQAGGQARRLTITSDGPIGPQRRESIAAAQSDMAVISEERPDTPDSMQPAHGSPENISEATLTDQPMDLEVNGAPLVKIDSGPGADTQIDDDATALQPGKPELPKRPPPVPPRPKAPKREVTWREQAEAAALQQDVTEVIDNVLFKIMCAIRPEGQDQNGVQLDHIKDLFFGRYRWTYMENKVEAREEQFMSVDVSLETKPEDIYAGLDTFFDAEDIILDGKPNRRFPTLTQVPPMFSVAIARQGYNLEKNEPYVIKHHMALEHTIYLDRFMQSGPPGLRAQREKSHELRTALRKLRARRAEQSNNSIGIDNAATMDAVLQFINEISADLSTNDAADGGDELSVKMSPQDLTILSNSVRKKAEAYREAQQALEHEIKQRSEVIKAQFADLREIAYDLAAVFMHRGQGGTRGGHYWIYIRDFKADLWRRYEDREVSVVKDVGDIFEAADPETHGAPYFVVYVDAKKKEQLIDALQRSPPPVDVDEERLEDPDSHMKEITDGTDNSSPATASSRTVQGARSAKEQVLMDNIMDLDGDALVVDDLDPMAKPPVR